MTAANNKNSNDEKLTTDQPKEEDKRMDTKESRRVHPKGKEKPGLKQAK